MKQRTIEEIAQALARDLAELFTAALTHTEQPAPGPTTRLYSFDELAEMMGKSKSTVSQWVRAGEFGEPVKVGNSIRVTQAGVDKYIADHSGPTKKRPSRARARTMRPATATPGKTPQTVTPTDGKVLRAVTVEAIPEEYVNTADATAISGHILADQTAYVRGEKVTGTMANHGDVTASMDGLTMSSVSIPAGYTTGGTVSLTDDIAKALAAV